MKLLFHQEQMRLIYHLEHMSLIYHHRPKRRFSRNKWVNGETPYLWRRGDDGWAITCGPSAFLVAEGPMWSASHGLRLLKCLQDHWQLRIRTNRKKRRVRVR